MKLEYSVEEMVKTRYSVRTYTDQPISAQVIEQINAYINKLSNPFSKKVNFSILETRNSSKSEKLGTYGVIKGSTNYIGATVAKEEMALEALGYEFEKLVLYLASLNLGTCWLGGTFNRNSFANALEVNENEIFPIISPFGYAANKKRFADSLVRKIAKSDQREPWNKLFFNKEYETVLTQEEAGAYAFALEMVRLAPSASNKQPWRIIKDGSTFHFYEEKAKGYSDRFSYDIQSIDLGIAACHFHLPVLEKDLSGKFKIVKTPEIVVPENYIYSFSWISV
ncbi:MAG: nitroreductase family protein [Lachnotalea sp.]